MNYLLVSLIIGLVVINVGDKKDLTFKITSVLIVLVLYLWGRGH